MEAGTQRSETDADHDPRAIDERSTPVAIRPDIRAIDWAEGDAAGYRVRR
jgi:hypothetical protein